MSWQRVLPYGCPWCLYHRPRLSRCLSWRAVYGRSWVATVGLGWFAGAGIPPRAATWYVNHVRSAQDVGSSASARSMLVSGVATRATLRHPGNTGKQSHS